MSLKAKIARFVGYMLHRDYVFIRTKWCWLVNSEDSARRRAHGISDSRIGLLLALPLASGYALLGPFAIFMGRSSILLMLLPLVSVVGAWLLFRWLGISDDADPDRYRVADPSRGYRFGYRACSIFLLLPAALLSVFLMDECEDRYQEARVAEGYLMFDQGRYQDVVNYVASEQAQHPITGDYLTLVGLSLFKLGLDDLAAKSIEASVVDANTHFARYRGFYTDAADRSSCPRYVAQAPFPAAQAFRRPLLEKLYCDAFAADFPGPVTSGRLRPGL